MPTRRVNRHNRKRSNSRLGTFSQSVTLAPKLVSMPRGHLYWAKLPAAFLLVASIWLLAVLHITPRFFVSEVDVQGVHLIDVDDVRTAAAVEGISIFRVQPHHLRNRLRDTFGCIDQVEISCRLPGTVSILVREREAVVIWQSGNRNWWIGSDGSILGTTEVLGHLPVIRDATGSMGEPTQYLVGIPWRLAQDMAVALPSATTYDYVSGLGLVAHVTDAQWPVYFGYEGNAQNKVAILQSLVQHLVGQGADVEYIDLRNEHSPMYKKRL
jgi:cell division septal protein FtsQ